MSHRRPEQVPPGLDGALRNALRLAVDSVEPAADGLDRIRARITSGRRAPWVGWRLVAVTYLDMVWRLLGLAVASMRRAADAVTARFGREPGRTDLLGWLRPAAAVATFVFVVGSASWAIAVLPSATTSGNNQPYIAPTGGAGGQASSSSAGPGGSTTYGGATSPGGTVGSPSPSAAGSSCPSTTPAPSQSSSSSPPVSPSPSSSATSSSPPVSPSPSASPSSSDSSTSAPTASPSSAVIPQSPVTPTGDTQVRQAILLGQRQGPGGTAGTRSTVQSTSSVQSSSAAQNSPAPPTHPAGALCGG